MEYTPNLNLRKPSHDDPVDIGDINYNMDILDSNGGGSPNLDGGKPNTNYGGIDSIVGGGV